MRNPPLWLMLIEAAHGDPLRAQEIEAGLNQVWAERYFVYRDELGQAMKRQEQQVKRGKRKTRN